ncbi:MAG: TonB-dependent receptor [Opitutaceae bacterium]
MHALYRILRACLLGIWLAVSLQAAETVKSYDLPSGEAAKTLKQFSEISGRETLFSADAVRGIKTPAVRGTLTAEQAIDSLLEGTGLIAVIDAKTGAFAVRKVPASVLKNAQSRRADSAAAANELRIVRLEEFLVKGIRAPGPVNEGVIPRLTDRAVAFQIYDRAAIENSGANSLGEFFRSYSGNTSSGLGFQSVFGSSTNLANGPGDTADRINLRGLGNNRTIVLLNGRRLYGSDSAGPDISRVPLSAVERVEILSGAGAAIYGANAVGGAVNIITRRSYNSAELTGYLGTSTGGGATEWRGTLYGGLSLNHGRTSGSLIIEHSDRSELRASEREFYRDILTAVPSTNSFYRTIAGNLLRTPRALITTTAAGGLQLSSNPTANATSVPAGYRSSGPVANDFNSLAGQLPVDFRRAGAVLLQPAAKIDSLNFQGEHHFLKDRLEAYTELAWRYQSARNSIPGAGGMASLAATSLLNPFRADPANGRPVGLAISVVWNPVDVPLDESFALQRTVRAVGGLKGKLGHAKKWAWAVDYSYDRNEGYSRYLQHSSSLNDAVTAGIYDPFRDLSIYPNTINLAQLTQTNVIRNLPEISIGNVRVSGEVIEWRAGPIGLSVGGEMRREEIKGVSITDYSAIRRQVSPATVVSSSLSGNGQTKGSGEARAAYAELNVPLIGGSLMFPLVEAVELSFAVRREDYGRYAYRSTYGAGVQSAAEPEEVGAAPLTMAVLWRPVKDVAFRASYSETFVSPTMDQFFSARFTLPNASAVTFFDPVLNLTATRPAGAVAVTSGGNPTLLPESGRSYNYGVILKPRWASGLSVNADLFHVVSYNQIRSPNVQTVIGFFPSRVTRDAGNNVIAYDASAVNMSEVVVGGADLRLAWQIPVTTLGTVALQAGATYTDFYKQKAIIGNPFLAGVGDRTLDSGVPLRWKGSSSLTLSRDAWTVGVTARYVGKYKDTFNTGLAVPNPFGGVDGDHIRSQVEFDVRLGYDFGDGGAGWRRLTKGMRASLGALNVLDRRPPYLSSLVGGANYSYYNDPRMRFVYLEVSKRL